MKWLNNCALACSLAAALLALPMLANAQQAEFPEPDEATIFAEAPDDHAMGAEEAPITMIVYASVTCSHCSHWFTNQWPKVKSDLVETGKVRFVMRELPTPPQQLVMTGFILAECAPEEDYFDVIEYQMIEQSNIFEKAKAGEVKEEYNKIAAMAGMDDVPAIEACFSESSNIQHIATSQMRANAAGVKGVPAFYINGAAYDGKQDAGSLIELIEIMDEAGVSELPKSLPKSLQKPEEVSDHKDHTGHNH